MKRWARFLGQFERICQTFFTETHNLKINPEEPSGFGVRSLSGAFICFHPGLDHVMDMPVGACSALWRVSCGCRLLKPEQKKEEAPDAPGGRKKHTWHLEESLSPSFACELKLCQFMSNPSDWHFTLKPHSEESSPLQVRDISNKPILNSPFFPHCKATASPSECSCWSSFCSTREAAESGL